MKRAGHIAFALSLASATAVALGAEPGQSLEDALDDIQARGLSILYSSDLVEPAMRVLEAPTARSPRAALEQIVRPHGIRVVEGPGGLLLLTRMRARAPRPAAASVGPAVPEIIVTASRYEWLRVPQSSLTRLTAAELRLAPNVGDDPLRTLARLPGAASTDLSAKLNVRGGAADEMLVRFDGLRLMNPFHLKDFQSVFSAINPALIGAVDAYTGGFPVRFGDRMSGVLDIHPVRAEGRGNREIAVSLYNASAFAAGRLERGRTDWAVSARRGNLERVLQWSGMDMGKPAYSDVYAHLGRRFADSLSISANLLRFDDDIELADSDREERARASYRDRYLWLRLDVHPRESLHGSTILSRADLDSARSGSAGQPGISRGVLADRRGFTVHSLQTDWTWRALDAAVLQLGGEWRHSTGRYEYRDEAGFDLVFDVPDTTAREGGGYRLGARPRGDQYGAYAAVQAELAPGLAVEGGVRWQRSTLGAEEDGWDPRLSALYRLSDSASLRASWGVFHQSQGVDELPVSDGVDSFFAAQRATHWVLSYEQRLGADLDLRIEAYRKRYAHPRPRFENLLNTLVILPELKPDRVRIAPAGARSSGLEVSLRSLRARPLFWWASYTFGRTEDVFPDRSVPRSWDRRHALNAGIGWQTERWELSLAGAWHSGWPGTTLELANVDGRRLVRAPGANTRRMPPYLDIDARLARKFQLGDGGTLTAFLEVSNVLNRRNVCCTEYEIGDDEDEAELVLEPMRSLPLLPSIGVIWKF